jgi:phenylalanyl-tRNA synthetase beta chain
MLCSAKELGLVDDVNGLLVLPADAPVGSPLASYLSLDDTVFEINVTPNRGDCFSVIGIARELAARRGMPLTAPRTSGVPATIEDTFPVELRADAACPRFVGRVLRGLRRGAKTPLWMRERLRRAGVRPLQPIVDVTNYVMLELGQPLHAYDLAKLEGGIQVRLANPGETLTLLDGRAVALDPDMLVIADRSRPQAIAGVMGGARSEVSAATRAVVFESAWFLPRSVRRTSKRVGLKTEASTRFERGADSEAPVAALGRVLDLADLGRDQVGRRGRSVGLTGARVRAGGHGSRAQFHVHGQVAAAQ